MEWGGGGGSSAPPPTLIPIFLSSFRAVFEKGPQSAECISFFISFKTSKGCGGGGGEASVWDIYQKNTILKGYPFRELDTF